MKHLVRIAWPVASAIVLIFLISTHTLVAYLESENPEAALLIRSGDAGAKLQIANAFLTKRQEAIDGGGAADDAADPDAAEPERAKHIRDLVKQAIYAEPLSARAFEILGILSAQEERPSAATGFMQAATRRSLRTPAALYWLMRRKAEEGDIDSAVAMGDVLLRIRPSTVSIVGPTIAKMASSPRGTEDVAAALAKPALWRDNFLRFLNTDTRYSDLPLKLFVDLKDTSHPPTEEEISRYIWSLAGNRKFESAYYAWLQFLPPQKAKAASLLFNGNFRFAPSAVPFDWTIPAGDGVISEITADDSLPGKNILWIELGGGRVDFRPVSEMLVLGPGQYGLSGLSKGQLDGPRGLKWQIVCLAPRSKTIAETPMLLGDISQWVQFSLNFEIPAGCAAQSLQLVLDARSPADRLVSGSMAFADLKIMRD